MAWQPSSTLEQLKFRAATMAAIRVFFANRNMLEVELPVLGSHTVTDPNLESLVVAMGDSRLFLQTSPEYFMKRLLAAGSGAIYSLGKAFRKDERGRNHNPEFTLLEWYRPGLDERELANEVIALVEHLQPGIKSTSSRYDELFEAFCGVNPHRASVAELKALAKQRLNIDWPDEHRSVWLDVLFTHLVEPELGGRLQLVFDFPACQSALAQTYCNPQGDTVARRFELYWCGLELANGYFELTDASEQRRRFDDDCALREELGREYVQADENLLKALEEGLPPCAGVALGVDRLLMCLQGKTDISDVVSFR